MEERDRIDIVATLHDRFNKPADDILRKMEEMERQADDTGDAIDGMSDSLDENTDSAKKNTKATGENTKARERQGRALDKGAESVDEHTRSLKGNTRALRENLKPTLRQTEALGKGAKNASQMAQGIADSAEASREGADAVQRHSRAVKDSTKKVARARDELGRFTKTVDKSSESIKDNTKATKKNTDETAKNTKTRRKDRDEWTKWNNKISKITSGLSSKFRPIGAFYQNYFKVVSAFRALLFSDIGAAIPQLITATVALGSAFSATLAPMGRLLAGAAQLAPAMAAYATTMATVKIGIGSVTEALTLLTDGKYDETMRDDYIEQYGENTFTLAEALIEVRDAYSDLKKSVSENLFEGMADSVKDLAMDYLPILEEGLGKTATIMNGELREGFTALQSPDKKGTIADVLDRSAEASGLFVDILFSLLDVFIELSDAAGPAFIETLTAIDEKLDKFAGWIRDNKDDLTQFFLDANDTAGEFFRGLGGIFRGLHGISQAAEPLTDFLYGGLADRLVEWGDRMNDPEQQEVMRENYEKMIPNLEAIGNLIGSIIEGAKEISTSEYFAPLVNDLAENGIPMIVDYLKALDETVGPPLLRISQALDEMDPDVLTSILAPLGDMLGFLATVMEIVLPLFSALPEPMQKTVMYGMGLVAMGLPGFFMLLLGPVSFVLKHFEALSKIFGKLKNSKFGKAMGKIFKPVIEFAKKWGGKLLKPLGALGKFLGKKSFAVIPVVGTAIAVLWTLWDVIKWLWDNVEPFRNFMTAVWEGIKTAWNVSIDWIVNTAIPWVVDAFWAVWDAIKAVGEWLTDFYSKYIKPVIDGIVKFAKIVFVTLATIFIILMIPFKLLWDYVLKPLLGWLLDVFLVGLGQLWADIKTIAGWIVDAAKWVWDTLSAGFKWLIDGLVWLWNGFVDVLKWVWNFIIDYIISPALVWLQTYAWPVIKWVIDAIVWAWNGLVDVLKWVWNFITDYIIAPALAWFETHMWPRIEWVVDKIVGAFNWMKDKIGNAWDWIKDKMSTVYNEKIKPVIDSFKEAINALKDSFNVAKEAIGKAWDEIKNRAKKPIGFVIDNVYNQGILPVWNKLAEAVKLDTRLKEVTWAKDGYDTGGYTGPGSKYTPAGIVHADEFVIRKESQMSLRREAPGFLDDLNRYGAKALAGAGYAGGGWVKPFQGNYGINSPYGQRGGRLHAGVDYPVPSGTALTAVSNGQIVQRGWNPAAGNKISMSTDMKGIVAGYHHLSRYVARRGESVSKGQIIAYSGNTGRSSGPHLHFSIKRDGKYVNPVPYLSGTGAEGTGEGGGWSLPSIPNPFDGMLNRLLSRLPGKGGFKDIAVNATKTMVNSAKDFVADKLSYSNDWIYDTAGNVLDGGKSVISAAGTAMWSGTAGKALQRTGDYSDANLRSLLRRMNKESGGNPRAINNWDSNAKRGTPSKGLMQVIDPTFRAYRDPSLPNNIYDPMANIVAAINYTKSRYGNLQAGWNRPGGYSGGGLVVDHARFMGGPVETWGNTLVGEFGPEIFTPFDGGPSSLLGLHGPEVLEFNREGAITPHKAVAALSEVNAATGHHSETHESTESNHYDVKVTVGGSATEHDIEGAVYRAIEKAERKKRERR